MTFTMAVAAGAVASRTLSHSVRGQAVSVREHRDLCVAWADPSPWVSSHDDGDVLVVLDGRLHEQESDGTSQAHLLLERYRAVGERLAEGLLGDFVLVVLDRTRARLIVARDPVGVRPWYRASVGTAHAGASDAATLARLPWVDTDVDEGVALAYLAGRAESRGDTLHRGIKTLAPGTTCTISEGASTTRLHHEWTIRPEPRLRWDDAAARAREALDAAVRSRLQIMDAPTSDCSGGLDSSSVVGTAVLQGCSDLTVGRLLFEGPHADERQYSDAVIQRWKLPEVSAAPWLPSEEESAALTALLHRPPPDPNFTMFASLHRALLAQGRNTVMTGLGGDDAFVTVSVEARVLSILPLRQARVLTQLLRATAKDRQGAWRTTWRPALRHRVRGPRRRPPGYVDESAARRLGLTQRTAAPITTLTGVPAIDERADGITSGYCASILEDAAVVADLSGVRSTHPFLDPRLITATYGVDPWFASRGGHDRALEVAAYADRLPEAVLTRRSKAEFSEVVWPTALTERAVGRILGGPLVERGWLDLGGFDNVLRTAWQGHSYAALPLSRALALDRWLRQDDKEA